MTSSLTLRILKVFLFQVNKLDDDIIASIRKLLTSNKIYIGTSTIKNAGRGVFAARKIKKGELIERCPVIEVSKNDTSNLTESILVTYFFYFGKKKEKIMISLGYGSIYNHSYEPNAAYKINSREKIMDILAIRNINKEEEISINYVLGNPKDGAPLWFEVPVSSKNS